MSGEYTPYGLPVVSEEVAKGIATQMSAASPMGDQLSLQDMIVTDMLNKDQRWLSLLIVSANNEAHAIFGQNTKQANLASGLLLKTACAVYLALAEQEIRNKQECSPVDSSDA